MQLRLALLYTSILLVFLNSCSKPNSESKEISAADILGNSDYPAFCYGGYRLDTRDSVPTIEELKDDMKILDAMGIKIIRTYNTQQYAHASNLLEAIHQLKNEDHEFEMYVMLGAWIDCEGAWTDTVNHNAEDLENNSSEINAAVEMAQQYPDIVKIIAVGNEAMVHWATSYFVYPDVILKWVNYLQQLKIKGDISEDIWITSSDNFASWGGGDNSYHLEDLTELIKAVDYISLHTYPFHDSHNNPSFWGVPADEESFSDVEKADAAMLRAKKYAKMQYKATADYIAGLGIEKPIHIGETGWATVSGSSFGASGSQAADEYKGKLYYEHMRDWTNKAGMSCFYFEAFDEKWKDKNSVLGSENHFGLINLDGQAKYALWELVDDGVFNGLTRNGIPITKTYGGDKNALMADMLIPPLMSEMGILEISTVNKKRESGEKVTENKYVLVNELLKPNGKNDITYPSAQLKLNSWEGTCNIEMSHEGIIQVTTGTGGWWGCALELQSGGTGEDLSGFKDGVLHFSIKGNTSSTFILGFQTGNFARGTQVNNFVIFGPEEKYSIKEDWTTYTIAISELDNGADLTNVTAPIFFRGDKNFDGKNLYVKNIYYSK
jgi:exo-beta-1,3-glucanase (GH17 family)